MKRMLTLIPLALTALTAPTAAAQAVRKPAARPATATHAKPAATPVAKATAAPAKPVAKAAPVATPQSEPAPTLAPAPAAAKAENAPFGVGTNALNLGIGIGSRYGYGGGLFGGNSSVSPAISLSYERGILPLGPGVLGVGVFAGYQGASYDLGGGDKWKYTDVIVTLRGAFHYPVLPQFDAYGGVGLGLRHAGVSYSGNSMYDFGTASANEFASGLFVGGRYFFTSNIGSFAELGYDQSYLKVGLSAKF